jgi:hypothetical protein
MHTVLYFDPFTAYRHHNSEMSIHHFSGNWRKIHDKCGKNKSWERKTSNEWKKKTTYFLLTPTNKTHKSYFHTVCTSLLGILYQVNAAPYVETIPVCLFLT